MKKSNISTILSIAEKTKSKTLRESSPSEGMRNYEIQLPFDTMSLKMVTPAMVVKRGCFRWNV
jgi:hypothetical protein